jgi:hypothetical protein
MDPYLEARWSNVHVLMMGAITAALNQRLPADLEARPEEAVVVDTVIKRNVQIIDTHCGGRVVTVIEVLRPWNKSLAN